MERWNKKKSRGNSASGSYENYASQGYNRGGYNSHGYSNRYNYRSRNKYGSHSRNDNNYSWSWGNYSFDRLQDDNSDLIIKSDEGYLTPINYSIKSRLGWNTGEETLRFVKNMCRYFYHEMLEEEDYYEEKFKDKLDELPEKVLSEYNNIKGTIEVIKATNIPGYTPLEKAEHLVQSLSSKNPNNNVDDLVSQASSLTNELEFDTNTFSDPILNELCDITDFSKKAKFEILNKISLIKGFGEKFKVEVDITEKEVEFSALTTIRKMRDMSQFRKIEMYQRMLPIFDVKLALKDLLVQTCVDRTESMQKIIVLVDYSGSMDTHIKQQWVCAFLIDRLKYVMKGECEIFFSFFVSNPKKLKFTRIHDRKSAIDFWKTFSTRPTGGITDIGSIINYIGKDIKHFKRLCNLDIDLSEQAVEALIINDGHDDIRTDAFTYKTNALSILENNSQLRKACLDNGGKYVAVLGKQIKEYE